LILDADAPLSPPESGGFSLLSYNVLLPNSTSATSAASPAASGLDEGEPGWWVFKYYNPTVPDACREWPHRKALLRSGLLAARADIICLQETVAGTFATDWDFLDGYSSALHRKGDIRCATFWRRDRFALVGEPQHPDRTLLTSLASIADPGRVVQVINCHLKAGADAARRLRQVTEALEQARKTRASGEGALVLAGDFNSDPEGTAVEQLLREGVVEPGFREAAFGDQPLTSKPRRQPFGPFADAYEQAYGRGQSPATLLLPDRYGVFLDERGALQPAIEGAIGEIFRRFAGGHPVMDRAAVDRWITVINRRPGRGSEWTKAQRVFQERGAEQLSATDLMGIYLAELAEGKGWGVLHDLYACGVAPRLSLGVFAGRFDQIHFTALGLEAVREPIGAARLRDVYERGETLPNGWHPSDHAPVGAVFRW
jgi:hypothetical protein